jgi:HlyD family secretion protein
MRVGWIVALIVVVLAGVFAFGYGGGVQVSAARVELRPIREFVDEQGQTRLPNTYLVTMPFAGRIEPIELTEGTPVKAGQTVARVVPSDLELAVAEAQAAVDRAVASVAENRDTSIELTTLQQTLKYVESIDRTVDAAAARVRSGEAKLDYANKSLERNRAMRTSNASTIDQLNAAEVAQVDASVGYQQDRLVLAALQAIQAATALAPTVVRQYIERKGLTVAVVKQELAQNEARLRQQRRDQERGVMRSPINGVVLDRLESNERQITAGTVLLKIGALDQLEVEADILSQDVVNVKPGDKVEVYGTAIGPKPAEAVVDKIYPAGFTKISSLGVEQQRVKVVMQFMDGELSRLRTERNLGVGYRVRVRIFTADRSRALVIPRSALFRGPGGEWQAFAIRRGRAELQTVEVGLMNDETVEIVAGLAENEIVVLAPEASLTAGARARPMGLKNELDFR